VTSIKTDVENIMLLHNGDFKMVSSKMNLVLVSFPFTRNKYYLKISKNIGASLLISSFTIEQS
jgi:hypothetical protein